MRALFKLLANTVGQPGFGCEVGVWRGQTSEYLLGKFPELRLTMVDRWQPYVAGEDGGWMAKADVVYMHTVLMEALRRTDFAHDRRTVLIDDSARAAECVRDLSQDFVFIDANHSHEGVLRDLQLWWPKVRQGGVFCGHDYSSRHEGVVSAVDEFFGLVELPVNVDGMAHIWWREKP